MMNSEQHISKGDTFTQHVNPVVHLEKLCQGKGLWPVYKKSVVHQKCLMEVTVGDYTVVGEGWNKNLAKYNAATLLLEKIFGKKCMDSDGDNSQTGNYRHISLHDGSPQDDLDVDKKRVLEESKTMTAHTSVKDDSLSKENYFFMRDKVGSFKTNSVDRKNTSFVVKSPQEKQLDSDGRGCSKRAIMKEEYEEIECSRKRNRICVNDGQGSDVKVSDVKGSDVKGSDVKGSDYMGYDCQMVDLQKKLKAFHLGKQLGCECRGCSKKGAIIEEEYEEIEYTRKRKRFYVIDGQGSDVKGRDAMGSDNIGYDNCQVADLQKKLKAAHLEIFELRRLLGLKEASGPNVNGADTALEDKFKGLKGSDQLQVKNSAKSIPPDSKEGQDSTAETELEQDFKTLSFQESKI